MKALKRIEAKVKAENMNASVNRILEVVMTAIRQADEEMLERLYKEAIGNMRKHNELCYSRRVL